jgi:hypothetical protein
MSKGSKGFSSDMGVNCQYFNFIHSEKQYIMQVKKMPRPIGVAFLLIFLYWERHRNGRGFKPYPLDNQTTVNTRTTLAPEMFDDVKGVIRSRKCKKDRRVNKTNNYLILFILLALFSEV